MGGVGKQGIFEDKCVDILKTVGLLQSYNKYAYALLIDANNRIDNLELCKLEF